MSNILNEIWKYLTVYLFSMFKFVGGPLSGLVAGLSLVETVIFTVLGMMTTVFIISYLGKKIKEKYFSKRTKRLFTKRNRRIVSTWKKYGLTGIAFLTPILFSPIIGTAIASAFGERPKKILLFMFFSAMFWGFTLSIFFFKVGRLALFSKILGQ